MPKFIIALALSLTFNNIKAQLVVVDTFNSSNINDLAQTLVGSGVEILNVQYQCDDKGLGTFNGNNSNIGINEGIILTSGYAATAVGPNNMSGSGDDLLRAGDTQIDQITAPNTSQDACVLEFDFIPDGDTIKFNYVFGSEEYPEYVNAGFNDAFAFFINGPGVPLQNIALIPNTNIPVTIDNVNNGAGNFGPCQNCTYYVNNGEGMTPNINTSVQYDGFTTVLQAKIAVSPCDTYHLKMVVSDVGDGILDSGVFIEKGSLSSRDIQLSSIASSSFFNSLVENCLDGQFEFLRRGNISDSLEISFTIGGTAINGTDYDSIGNTVLFLPNDSLAKVEIKVISDLIQDDNETIKVYLNAACTGLPYDSAELLIKEPFVPDVFLNDLDLCKGDSTTLNNVYDSMFSYQWTPNYMLSCDTCALSQSYADTTTTYILNVNHIPGCDFSDTMTLSVYNKPNVDLGEDTAFCVGENTLLNPSANTNYNWSWNNPNGLSCTNCPSPIASPNGNNTYIASAEIAGCSSNDTISITVYQLPNTSAGMDKSLCFGDSVLLNAQGADILSWSPSTYLSNANNATTWCSATNSITYILTGIDTSTMCQKKDEINITVNPLPSADAGDDFNICDDSMKIIGSTALSNHSYIWSPNTGLSSDNIAQPNFQYQNNNDTVLIFYLTVTNAFGCTNKDSIRINLFPNPIANAGNDTTIVYGYSLALQGTLGDQYIWSPDLWLSDPNISNPISTPQESIGYKLIVETQNGCTNSDSIFITILESAVAMPNAFSPNGDGQNDFYGAFGLPIKDFKLSIYDRWGKSVFESSDIQQHWNGRLNGVEQPIGTYIYVLSGSYEDESILLKGNFSLIR